MDAVVAVASVASFVQRLLQGSEIDRQSPVYLELAMQLTTARFHSVELFSHAKVVDLPGEWPVPLR